MVALIGQFLDTKALIFQEKQFLHCLENTKVLGLSILCLTFDLKAFLFL